MSINTLGKLRTLNVVGFALVDIFTDENVLFQIKALWALAINAMARVIDTVASLLKVQKRIINYLFIFEVEKYFQ